MLQIHHSRSPGIREAERNEYRMQNMQHHAFPGARVTHNLPSGHTRKDVLD